MPSGELVAMAMDTFSSNRENTRWGMGMLLEHLEKHPGETWQQRWEAAGLNEPGASVCALAEPASPKHYRLNAATGQAFTMRLIQPTLRAFRAYSFFRYPDWFRRVARNPLLEEFCAKLENKPISLVLKRKAKFDLCSALTVFGIDLADLTPEALLHYAVESRKHGLTKGERPGDGVFAATQVWPVLYDMGHFPASAPRTLRAAVTKGQRTMAELVDQRHLRNHEIRELLVDYLTRRAVTLDYSSASSLARTLAGTFWKQIEAINPDQTDLRLAPETVTRWKEWLQTLPNGQPRKDIDGPLMAVRALYLDLHTWAAAEPERWSRWVAPSPIRDEDLRWAQLRRRRINERMAARTRQRQPLLPVLSEHVTSQWDRLRALLEAARQVELGARFTLDGVEYQRTASDRDRRGWSNPDHAPVRVINRATGQLVRVSHEENQAFWQWAVIETLRLAGLRVEELVELTHLSVRNYQRTNGEVIALLVVAPSKSDRERVIPMSAELFHVIAQVIRRHLRNHGAVPVVTRYDLHEKVWTEPMPFLFQTVHSGDIRGMSTHTAWRMIHRAVDELAGTRPEFAEVSFAPHDFRRLLATEMVNNGLPIHIGAALLGHMDIRTTRGYVAVFDEDVVRHYQEFIERRRQQRPQEEYRKPDDDEWSEFQEHFDKRRVELGSCGRPYGTGCTHEHACIRCPMLSVDPKMLPRLDEIEQDLVDRRARAVAEGWRGEIDGIDLTLTFLRGKLAQAQRTAAAGRPGPTDLGIPAVRVAP